MANVDTDASQVQSYLCVIISTYNILPVCFNLIIYYHTNKVRRVGYRVCTVIELSACFSACVDTMVWEVVTPAVPSSEPIHHNMRRSEPEGEHTGTTEQCTAALTRIGTQCFLQDFIKQWRQVCPNNNPRQMFYV